VRVESPDGARVIRSSNIIVATGARPRPIPGMPLDGVRIMSSREALARRKRPESIVIIGAGAIGVEFAYFYNAMGTKVTLVEMLPRILPIEDEEISTALEKSFRAQGIEVLTGARTSSWDVGSSSVRFTLEIEGESRTVEAETSLIAIGVTPNTENLGLEALGATLDRGFVKVNERLSTGVESLYAIGDVAGPPLLAHKASAEGIACVEGIAGEEFSPVNYANIPGCTYCQPQVASIGLTEKKAREAGYEVKIGKFPFSASGKAIAIGEAHGFVKIVVDGTYGEILGTHIIGSEATEMIAEVGLARGMEATYLEILKTVHAHPTLTEAIMEAAGDANNEAIHI